MASVPFAVSMSALRWCDLESSHNCAAPVWRLLRHSVLPFKLHRYLLLSLSAPVHVSLPSSHWQRLSAEPKPSFMKTIEQSPRAYRATFHSSLPRISAAVTGYVPFSAQERECNDGPCLCPIADACPLLCHSVLACIFIHFRVLLVSGVSVYVCVNPVRSMFCGSIYCVLLRIALLQISHMCLRSLPLFLYSVHLSLLVA